MLATHSHTLTRQQKKFLRFSQMIIGLIVVMVALSGCDSSTGSTASQDAPMPEAVVSPVDEPATEAVPTETPIPPPPDGAFSFSERDEFERVDGLEAVGEAFRDLVDIDESDVMVVGKSTNEGYRWNVYADVTSDGERVRYIPRLDDAQNVVGVDVIHEAALEAYGFSLEDVVFDAFEEGPTLSGFAILGEPEGRPVAQLSQTTKDSTGVILNPENYSDEQREILPSKPDTGGEVMLVVGTEDTEPDSGGSGVSGEIEVNEGGPNVLSHLEPGMIVFTTSYDFGDVSRMQIWDGDEKKWVPLEDYVIVGEQVRLTEDGDEIAYETYYKWNPDLGFWGEVYVDGQVRVDEETGARLIYSEEAGRWEFDLGEQYLFGSTPDGTMKTYSMFDPKQVDPDVDLTPRLNADFFRNLLGDSLELSMHTVTLVNEDKEENNEGGEDMEVKGAVRMSEEARQYEIVTYVIGDDGSIRLDYHPIDPDTVTIETYAIDWSVTNQDMIHGLPHGDRSVRTPREILYMYEGSNTLVYIELGIPSAFEADIILNEPVGGLVSSSLNFVFFPTEKEMMNFLTNPMYLTTLEVENLKAVEAALGRKQALKDEIDNAGEWKPYLD